MRHCQRDSYDMKAIVNVGNLGKPSRGQIKARRAYVFRLFDVQDGRQLSREQRSDMREFVSGRMSVSELHSRSRDRAFDCMSQRALRYLKREQVSDLVGAEVVAFERYVYGLTPWRSFQRHAWRLKKLRIQDVYESRESAMCCTCDTGLCKFHTEEDGGFVMCSCEEGTLDADCARHSAC